MSMSAEPMLWTEKQAAAAMGISFWSCRELVAAGLLPVVRLPNPLDPRRAMRRKLIDRRDVEKFIAQHKVGGGQ